MASSALIDDLLKQFAENPRRVFARLANEYRKNGELDTAIEICRAHVPLQPTYISGYIVLGQALYEGGQLDEARTTFETALGLDPENLIALRQLGDIARAKGDLTGARAWYRRLLEVDPQNDEISTQLRELDAPAGGPPAAATPADAPGVSWSDIHPEHASPPPAPLTEAATRSPAAPVEPLDFDFDVLSEFTTDSALTTPVRDDAGAVEEEPALGHEAVAEPAPAPEPAIAESVATPAQPESVSAATRQAVPADEQDEPLPAAFITETMAELYLQQGHREQALDIYRLLVAQRPGDLSLLNRIARLERPAPPAPPERTVRAFFGRLSNRRPPGAAPEPAMWREASVEPVHETEAEPAAPAADVAAPEAEAAEPASSTIPTPVPIEPSIMEFAAVESVAETPEPAPEVEPAAEPALVESAGASPEPVVDHVSSFAEMFGGRTSAADEQAASTLAGAFTVESAPSNGGGHPARAAADALSLDDVFGGGPGEHESGHVSFDEFFSSPNGAPSAPEPPDASSAPAAAPHRSDDADLELFHAWLEGLKK